MKGIALSILMAAFFVGMAIDQPKPEVMKIVVPIFLVFLAVTLVVVAVEK